MDQMHKHSSRSPCSGYKFSNIAKSMQADGFSSEFAGRFTTKPPRPDKASFQKQVRQQHLTLSGAFIATTL
jgi:hypothetical protein